MWNVKTTVTVSWHGLKGKITNGKHLKYTPLNSLGIATLRVWKFREIFRCIMWIILIPGLFLNGFSSIGGFPKICPVLYFFICFGWFVQEELCSNDNCVTRYFFPSLNMWYGGRRTQDFWNAADIKVISFWEK